jgi:hypothetical protein
MYNITVGGIVTMNPPVQQIYPNKNEKKKTQISWPCPSDSDSTVWGGA